MSYDSNLDRLTMVDLRAIAADLKIAGRSKMKRAELVAAITEAEAVNAATAEHENEEIDLTSTIDDMISGWLPVEVSHGETDAAEHTPGEQVAITKYSANEAIATAVFEGRSIGGHATRERGRWVLRAEGRVIRAKTLGKVAKLWAKALGFHATISVETMS